MARKVCHASFTSTLWKTDLFEHTKACKVYDAGLLMKSLEIPAIMNYC